MFALTLAVVTQLATTPSCGAAEPGSELANQLVATATVESSRDPYAVHVNGPVGGARYFDTEQKAIAYARALDAAGTDFDAGLLGINRRQFARHGLTIDTAFDACRSMRAGSEHLVDDVRSVLNLASRRYNCGRITCGAAYARKIDAFIARVGTAARPLPSPPPAPCAPAWDAWAMAACSTAPGIHKER